MSDEHEHEHGVPYFMLQMGPTREQMERNKMLQESNGHDLRRFVLGLDEEQLQALMQLILQVGNSSGAMGLIYQGIIAQRLEEKYGVCLGCGKKHGDELANITGQTPEKTADPVEPSHEPRKEFPAKGSAAYDSLMASYSMEQDDDGSDKVMCKNCGTWYQSLEDRTLRPAGIAGCNGCQHKSAWG